MDFKGLEKKHYSKCNEPYDIIQIMFTFRILAEI